MWHHYVLLTSSIQQNLSVWEPCYTASFKTTLPQPPNCLCCFSFFRHRICCDDDGCRLCYFTTNSKRKTATPTAMANTEIVIDKMHFQGHVDDWYKQTCNPYYCMQLETVISIEVYVNFELFHRSTRKYVNRHFHSYLNMPELQDT